MTAGRSLSNSFCVQEYPARVLSCASNVELLFEKGGVNEMSVNGGRVTEYRSTQDAWNTNEVPLGFDLGVDSRNREYTRVDWSKSMQVIVAEGEILNVSLSSYTSKLW